MPLTELPAFIEAEPDEFKSLTDCTLEEVTRYCAKLENTANGLLQEARQLRLYLIRREG